MTEAGPVARLVRLRPTLTDIIGFYELIDCGHIQTPLEAMRCRVRFTAASVKLAQNLQRIISDILEDEQ